MLTISLGFALHLYRVIFGDVLTLRHAATLTNDRILLVPMTYAGITGILVWRRVRFANNGIGRFFTASVIYIAGSVPLHIYLDYVVKDLTFVTWFPMWFSYLLLDRRLPGVPDDVLAAALQRLMPPNPERRAQLLDAAIDILADGASGA